MNLNKSQDAISYLALHLLGLDSNGLSPELLLFLTPEHIEKFIRIYGGKTLRIPSTTEYGMSMAAILYIYYVDICGMSRDSFKDKFKYSGHEMKSIGKKVENFKKYADEKELEYTKILKDLQYGER